MQFESLVEVCVGNKSTTHDVQSIILTHEHFITSEQLFRVLVGNFFEEEDIVQFRIVIFLKKWLDLVPSAFLESLPLKKCLNSFFEELETKRPEAMKVFQQAPNNEKSSPESPEETTAKTLRSCFPLIEHSPRAVASYLVLSDHALLCEIDTNELLKQRWLIPEQSPTLKACSDRIDRLCYWTTYKIINAPQKFRTKIADFYLKVCEHLLALQDFNALFGIFLGIMKLSDFGLNSFWKKSKNVDFYLKLKQICDFNNNFFTYRNLIKTLSFPLIEFQEIVLKDMLNITEGLPDEVNGALNVDKMLAMGKIIQRLNKSKATKFDNCSSSVGELDLLLSEIDNGMNWQQAVDKLREEHFKAEASKPIEKKDVPEQLKEQAKENRRTIKSMSIQKTKQGFRARTGSVSENVSFAANTHPEENRNSPNKRRFRTRAGTADSVSKKTLSGSCDNDVAIEQDQLDWDSLITELETNKESKPILNLSMKSDEPNQQLLKSQSLPLKSPPRGAVAFTSSSGALLSPHSTSFLESSSAERSSSVSPISSTSDLLFDTNSGPEVCLNFRPGGKHSSVTTPSATITKNDRSDST